MNKDNVSLENVTKIMLEQDFIFEDSLKGLLDDDIFNNISKDNLKSLLKLVSKQVDEHNVRASKLRQMCDNYQNTIHEQNIYIEKILSDLNEAYDMIENFIALIEVLIIPNSKTGVDIEDVAQWKENLYEYRTTNLPEKEN